MGRPPRIKKEPFEKDLKNQNIKKEPLGVLMESAVGIYFRRGKKSKFQGFCRWTLCTPKITGAPQAALRSKVLDQLFLLLSFYQDIKKEAYASFFMSYLLAR